MFIDQSFVDWCDEYTCTFEHAKATLSSQYFPPARVPTM